MMIESARKNKKLEPLVKARKIQLDIEATRLAEIRRERLAREAELVSNQQQYLKGIEELNRERQSNNRSKLSTLEQSVDYIKMLWYSNLKELRRLELVEQAQLANVRVAETNLKVIEKLGVKYQEETAAHMQLREQKEIDAIALRTYMSQRK